MPRLTGYAGLHDYNRAIRDIATSAEWQSGVLARQLGRVVEVAARMMGVSRVSVWRLSDDRDALHCLCQFDTHTGLVASDAKLTAAEYPHYFAALEQHRSLAVADAQHADETRELCADYLEPMGITSLLDAPIWLDGNMVGVVCHEHCGAPRVWRDEDSAFAGSMADFAAMALSQDRYRQTESVRERLARIVEATPDMVVVMTAEGYILQMNPAGRAMLGLSADADLSHTRGRDFLGEQGRSLMEDTILPALFTQGYWMGEAVLLEGTPRALPVSGVALAHRDVEGKVEYLSVTTRDLTVQKAIQREIEQLNNELETRVRVRTQELEVANRNLESFAYSVSHDLKAPLRGILGYSQLLGEEYQAALPAEAAEWVGLIGQAGLRMDRMIEDILAYSRAQMRPLVPGQLDAEKLVEQVVREFEPQWRAGAQLKLSIAPAWLQADREGVMQILRNFIANALKFSFKRTPPELCIEGYVAGGYYRFSVQDNGIGFEMRFHDRLFDMFQQLPSERANEGSGIGLALAARAAERQGGRVWATSVPGQGATFFFELPYEPTGEGAS